MYKVECNKGIIDVSECSIEIQTHSPMMPYDNFPECHNLVAMDFRTEKKTIIAQFNQKKWAESALEKIKNAMKNNENYVDIRDCESNDENMEDK